MKKIGEVELGKVLDEIKVLRDIDDFVMQVAKIGTSIDGPWSKKRRKLFKKLSKGCTIASSMRCSGDGMVGNDMEFDLSGFDQSPITNGNLVGNFMLKFLEVYREGMQNEKNLYQICAGAMDKLDDIIILGTKENGHWVRGKVVNGQTVWESMGGSASKLEWLTESYYNLLNAGESCRAAADKAKAALDDYCATDPKAVAWDIVWIPEVFYAHDKEDPAMHKTLAQRERQRHEDDLKMMIGLEATIETEEDNYTGEVRAGKEYGEDPNALDVNYWSKVPETKLEQLVYGFVQEVKNGKQTGSKARHIRTAICRMADEKAVLDILFNMDLRGCDAAYKDFDMHKDSYKLTKEYNIDASPVWYWKPDCKWEVKRPEISSRRIPAPVKLEVVDPEKDARIIEYNKTGLRVIINGSSFCDGTTSGGEAIMIPIRMRDMRKQVRVLKVDDEETRVRGIDWDMASSTRSNVRELIRQGVEWEDIRDYALSRQGVSTQIGSERVVSEQVPGIWVGNKCFGPRELGMFVGNFVTTASIHAKRIDATFYRGRGKMAKGDSRTVYQHPELRPQKWYSDTEGWPLPEGFVPLPEQKMVTMKGNGCE